jgi:hypothetical protein
MWHRQWYAITLEPSTVLLSLPPCNGRINAATHNAPCTPTCPPNIPLLEVGCREAPLDVCDTANAVTYYRPIHA